MFGGSWRNRTTYLLSASAELLTAIASDPNLTDGAAGSMLILPLTHPVPEADYPDIGFSWVSPPINFARSY